MFLNDDEIRPLDEMQTAVQDGQRLALIQAVAGDSRREQAFGRDDLMKRLAADFPDVLACIGPYDAGLLHCEVAAFRRATEQAIDAGRFWVAEKHFRLVEELLTESGPELRNALQVSYLEDFALGEWTETRHRAVRERMPRSLHQILIEHREKWR